MKQMIKKILKKYKNMSVVAKSSLWFVICGFFQRGISIITTPIFTRILTTEQYGTYSVYNSWLELLTIIVTLKLGYGVYVKGLVKYSDDKDEFSSSLLGLATLWWGCWLIVYIIFHSFINKILGLNTIMMICMFTMMISTVAYNFWAAEKRNEYKYVTLVKLTILTSLLKPIIGIIVVMCVDSYKVEARIISLALIELFVYSILYIKIFLKGKRFFKKKYWKYALMFNIPLVPHFVSQVILNHSDRIMINNLVGSSEAGVYSLAYSLAMVLTMLNTSILNSLRPWVFQNLEKKEYKTVGNFGIIALIVVSISNFVLIAFAPEIIKIFSPASYSNAMYLVPPITMGVVFAFMYNLFVDIQMFYEKTKSIMIISIICAVLNIALNLVFISKFGYVAAAYTTLVSYLLMAFLHYLSMIKMTKKHEGKIVIYKSKTLIFISVIFIISGLLMMLTFNNLLIRLLILIVLSLILYIKKEVFIYTVLEIKNSKVGKKE